jgi:hypothetical protein
MLKSEYKGWVYAELRNDLLNRYGERIAGMFPNVKGKEITFYIDIFFGDDELALETIRGYVNRNHITMSETEVKDLFYFLLPFLEDLRNL